MCCWPDLSQRRKAKIHERLADYGFILRYLEGADEITGYSYEPWHFRYINDPAIAKEIMDAGITLEEYLGEVPSEEDAASEDAASEDVVIEFLSDYHSPVDAVGAWEPDTEYTDWQWWLARTEGGEWELMTCGY